MNWQTLRLLYIHEIRTLVRARRTVVMALVIPTLVMPLMLYTSKFATARRQRALTDTMYLYAISGEMTDRIRELIAASKSTLDKAKNTDDDTEPPRDFKIQEAVVADPADSLERNEIQFYVQTYSGNQADAAPDINADSDDKPRLPGTPAAPKRL